MRIVSFGFQTWGVRTLQALVDLGHDVALSVTHPASDDSYKGIGSAARSGDSFGHAA